MSLPPTEDVHPTVVCLGCLNSSLDKTGLCHGFIFFRRAASTLHNPHHKANDKDESHSTREKTYKEVMTRGPL